MDYKNIETYDYNLDESLIAQTPLRERDHSKLLVVNKFSVDQFAYSKTISFPFLKSKFL